MSDYRYRVGCAGMFVLGMTSGYDDEDGAEEIDEAKARLAARP